MCVFSQIGVFLMRRGVGNVKGGRVRERGGILRVSKGELKYAVSSSSSRLKTL